MRTICLMLSLLLSGSLVAAPLQSRPHSLSATTAEPQRSPLGCTRIALVDVQRIATESVDGKAALAKVRALSAQNATAVELNQLQESLQSVFGQKLTPILRQAAIDLGFQMILSKADSGILWVDSGLDVTTEILKRFDNSGNTVPAAVVKALPMETTPTATSPAPAPPPVGRIIFRDEKNGYFSLIPPKTWNLERVEDARTKVTWRHPVERDVLLRVIARSATESMSEVLKNAQSTSAQHNARGIKTVLVEGRVGEYPAAVIDQWSSGAHSRIILFVAGGVHFNVQYAAPSERLFQREMNDTTGAIETLSPLPGKKSGDAAKQEELAWYKRYSFLLSKMNNLAGSKALATEGLVKYPDDPELKRLAEGTVELPPGSK